MAHLTASFRLSAAERRELEQRMQKQQMKAFFGIFSNLVDHCFMSCIDDFTSKSLNGRESGCITRCVQKQMALSQRLSERFQEHNALQQQQQGSFR
ncbi:mitochondrial intermembrane space translocase subunit [Hypoxylon cercidicola]|nr:mitochondrial intermembrane space translocase subunit [Hypoxylon cercidicola]